MGVTMCLGATFDETVLGLSIAILKSVHTIMHKKGPWVHEVGKSLNVSSSRFEAFESLGSLVHPLSSLNLFLRRF